MQYAKKASELLSKIRETHPLLHHITNFVVMNDNANMSLHIGAAPVMAHAMQEVEIMAGFASALVLNIGTLDEKWITSMDRAAKVASERNIPIILDPVGAGATPYRTETVVHFLKSYPIAILKGNLGEISSLAGLGGEVRGVDSAGGGEPAEVVKTAAQRFNTVAIATGEIDYISDGASTLAVKNGTHWLGTITGSGCSLTSVVAAFRAVEANGLIAGASALAAYSVAAELAAKNAGGPASFKVAFFDAVYNLTPEVLTQNAKIEEV